MNKLILKKGDKIIVDFDDTIAELKYPKIGKIKKGMRRFLKNCKKNKIEVYIWSARCNTPNKISNEFSIFGCKGVEQIRQFMKKNKLYFTDILIHNKPLGKHFCSYMLDDCCRCSPNQFKFRK